MPRISRDLTKIKSDKTSTELFNPKMISTNEYSIFKCRTCLGEGTIHMEESALTNLYNLVKLLIGMDVDEHDTYSKYLCRVCYEFVSNVLVFRETAQKCNRMLKEKINELIEPLENSPSDSIIHESNLTEDLQESDDLEPTKTCEPLTQSQDSDISKETTNSNKKKEKVQCEVCKKQINKYYYKGHMTLHGVGTPKPKKKVECTICKKTMENSYYKKHMSGVHGEGHSKYVCYVCGRTFRYESGYKSHIVSHKDEFPYKCQFCPYRGRHSGLLSVHMRIHTKDYKYQCTECQAMFLTNSNLHRHMLKHKEREFKCNMCTREFHKQSDLDKHVQADHMGIKNHICKICDKAFGYRSAMMKHQLHVHKRQKLDTGRTPDYLVAERSKLVNR